MKRIKSSQLEPGMILAEDIFGRSGEMLMPAGAQLTEKSIQLLRLREVSTLAIEGEEENPLAKYPQDKVKEVQDEMAKRFVADIQEGSAAETLVKLCVRRKLERLYPDQEETEEPSSAEPSDPETTPTPTESSTEKSSDNPQPSQEGAGS